MASHYLQKRSPTFLAPGTKISKDLKSWKGAGDGFGMIMGLFKSIEFIEFIEQEVELPVKVSNGRWL